MLLLLTGSDNRTSDRIVNHFGLDVFRLNFDLWSDYSITFSPNSWEIKNPAGHSISSKTVSRVFYWKAFSYPINEDKLVAAEINYIFREIYSWCVSRGMQRGNPFYFHQVCGKINILSKAKSHFQTPNTIVTSGTSMDERIGDLVVAKSLSSEVTEDYKAMMTTLVDPECLDPGYPWFLQEKVESNWDVTVFICGEKLFAFQRDRSSLKGIDWRAEQQCGRDGKEWIFFELDELNTEKVFNLSEELDVDWGRYDFMLSLDERELVFLEFNANGQWGFLDPLDEYGVFDQAVKYLS